MKKFVVISFLFVLFVSISSVFVSCDGGGGSGVSDIGNRFAGTWVADYNNIASEKMVITAKTDYTYVQELVQFNTRNEIYRGTYSVSGDRVNITIEGFPSSPYGTLISDTEFHYLNQVYYKQ